MIPVARIEGEGTPTTLVSPTEVRICGVTHSGRFELDYHFGDVLFIFDKLAVWPVQGDDFFVAEYIAWHFEEEELEWLFSTDHSTGKPKSHTMIGEYIFRLEQKRLSEPGT